MDKIWKSYKYKTADVLQHIAGLTQRKLDYWAEIGLIVPSVQKSQGPGTRKFYSLEDIILLKCLLLLKSNNWSTQLLRKQVGNLRAVIQSSNPVHRVDLIHPKGKTRAIICDKEPDKKDEADGTIWIIIDNLISKEARIVQPSLWENDQEQG